MGVANVALCLALIPPFGLRGAAIASFGGYASLAVLYWWWGRRVDDAPYEPWQLVVAFALAAAAGEAWRIDLDSAALTLLLKLAGLRRLPGRAAARARRAPGRPRRHARDRHGAAAGPQPAAERPGRAGRARYPPAAPCAVSPQPSTSAWRPAAPAVGRAHERPHRAPRARRQRPLGARARRRRLRPPAPRDHRPVADRRPADDRRRRRVDHVQRRDLQLRRAARGARRAGVPDASDTEVVLRAYRRWGVDCLEQLRGMFAFALWDEREQTLFCARDRFGIKPLYYAQVDGVLYLASEAKALLPFLPDDRDRPRGPAGLPDLPVRAARAAPSSAASQELLPGHYLLVRDGEVDRPALLGGRSTSRTSTTRSGTSSDRLEELVHDSVRLHLRSRRAGRRLRLAAASTPSIVGGLAAGAGRYRFQGFTGRFDVGPDFDESRYARDLARRARLRAARDRDRRPTTSARPSATSSTTSTSPSPARARSRSTWSRELAARARQGRARRPGRRRDLRRLRALPHRLLRAVHQGRHRGHVPTGQLRRHVRVDHPEPGDAARVQAAAAGVLARRAVRGPRPPLLPARRPRPAARRRHRPGRVRRGVAVRALPPHLPGRERAQGVVLRLDDALRLQDAAAGAAAGRGPRQHGPRPGVARAVRRPRGRRLRRDACRPT